MKIAIIGCGKLGTAFARGLKAQNHELLLVQKNGDKGASLSKEGFEVHTTISAAIKESDLILLAVKPQDFAAAAKDLKPVLTRDSAILSVMAGVSIDRIQKALIASDQIARSMPNLPAQVGKSISAVCFSPKMTAAAKERARKALLAVGQILELSSEDLMNAATAIAGSGPGYLFAFASALELAAQDLGFSKEEAAILVKSTFTGAGTLWERSTDSAFALQEKVKSKGGTTEAGLKVFEEADLVQIVTNAARAACARAKEL